MRCCSRNCQNSCIKIRFLFIDGAEGEGYQFLFLETLTGQECPREAYMSILVAFCQKNNPNASDATTPMAGRLRFPIVLRLRAPELSLRTATQYKT